MKFSTAAGDLLNTFFAVDRSVSTNFKEMLLHPGNIINLYLDGNRRFYFSPGRYLLIAAALLAFSFLKTNNSFFFVSLDIEGAAGQVVFLFLFLPIFSVGSWLTYLKFHKNLFEHFVINAYTFGFWLIGFSILNIFSAEIFPDWLQECMVGLFSLLVNLYNSFVFKLSVFKRVLYVLLNASSNF